MSSSQYLRNKMAAAPKILNTKKPLEASDITTKKRLAASRFFNLNGADVGTMREDSIMETSRGKQILSYQKLTGRPKDSSDFTAYKGAKGIDKDLAYQRGQLIANSSDPTSISACITIPTITPTKDASTITRERLLCHSFNPAVHTTGQVGPSLFVDDTIRLRPVDPSCSTCVPDANHSVKALSPYESTKHGPTKFTAISPQLGNNPPYKAGSLIPRPKYIEKHHGNDLNVNPQRQFVKYQGSHLPVERINFPRFGNVKP